MNWVLRVNYKVTQGSDMPRAPWSSILEFQCFVISGLLLEKLASTAAEVWENGKEVLNSASPQLLLGLATGLTSSLLLLRFSARIVRERRITWQVE